MRIVSVIGRNFNFLRGVELGKRGQGRDVVKIELCARVFGISSCREGEGGKIRGMIRSEREKSPIFFYPECRDARLRWQSQRGWMGGFGSVVARFRRAQS